MQDKVWKKKCVKL